MKPNKYRAKRTTNQFGTFDSRKEARVAGTLHALLHAGLVSNLRTQVPFKLKVNDQLICTYIADFVYADHSQGGAVEIVADAKGFRTPVYKLKKKLMLAIHGIDILEL